jgi:hypothetical protein
VSALDKLRSQMMMNGAISLDRKDASEILAHVSQLESRLNFVEPRYNDLTACLRTAQASVQKLIDDVNPPVKTWGQWGQKIDLGGDE